MTRSYEKRRYQRDLLFQSKGRGGNGGERDLRIRRTTGNFCRGLGKLISGLLTRGRSGALGTARGETFKSYNVIDAEKRI